MHLCILQLSYLKITSRSTFVAIYILQIKNQHTISSFLLPPPSPL